MEKEYFDVITWIAGQNGRNFPRTIGSAWRKKDGESWGIELQALPLPGQNGKVELTIQRRREREGGSGGGAPPMRERTGGGRAAPSMGDHEPDDIGF